MYKLSVWKQLLCLSLLLTSNNLYAELKAIKNAPLSTKNNTVCNFLVNGTTECIEDSSIEILTDEGRELVSKKIFYYNELDNIEVLQADQQAANSVKTIALDKANIDIKIESSAAKAFVRSKILTLVFPNLVQGSKIHYKIKKTYHKNPYYSGFYAELFLAQDEYRYDAYKITFNAPKAIIWRAENSANFNISQNKNKRQLVLELKNPPYYEVYINEMQNAHKRDNPRIVLSDQLDLNAHFTSLNQAYNKIIHSSLPPELNKLITDNADKNQVEQLTIFYKYLYKNLRNIGNWSLSPRGEIAFNLAEILQHGYADDKDFSVLLAALLNAANIKTEIALINNALDVPKLLIPSINNINQAILRIELDKKVFWLAPNKPFFLLEEKQDHTVDRWAIVLGTDGKPRVEQIPDNLTLSYAQVKNIKFLNTEEAQINLNKQYSVEPANLNMQTRQQGTDSTNQQLCLSAAKLLQDKNCAIEREPNTFSLKKNYTIQMQLTDSKAIEEIAPDTYLYEMAELFSKWDNFLNYYQQHNLLDLYLGKPQNISSIIQLDGYKIKSPRTCSVQSKWFDLSLQLTPKANGTEIKYQELFKHSWFEHQLIISDEFQHAVKQARDCVKQSNIVIKNMVATPQH